MCALTFARLVLYNISELPRQGLIYNRRAVEQSIQWYDLSGKVKGFSRRGSFELTTRSIGLADP